MALGGCAGELSMKVSCASVWRKVEVEEEGAKFERTMTSVGDAGDFQNRCCGISRRGRRVSGLRSVILLTCLSARPL